MEPKLSHLIDRYNRNLSYLRISITDRCNLRCRYCMPDGKTDKLAQESLLTYEEILRLAGIAVRLGVTKIRLTGGEPLLRKNIHDFIPRLTGIQGVEDVSLTTNGVYLKDHLQMLKQGGIKRINISLDTLQREKFKRLAGLDRWEKVREGIELASEMNFHPIKLNMVVMKGVNDDEVADMAKLSLKYPYHIRFIEYMPISICSQGSGLQGVPVHRIKDQLKGLGKMILVNKGNDDGPAVRYRFEGGLGEIGFISAMSQHFCDSCNRMRLTADGHIRACLLSNDQEDIKTPLRNGAGDQELAEIFLRAAHKKERKHLFTSNGNIAISAQMSSIGG
jgi:cyclic pyranopterin phosphate synthase